MTLHRWYAGLGGDTQRGPCLECGRKRRPPEGICRWPIRRRSKNSRSNSSKHSRKETLAESILRALKEDLRMDALDLANKLQISLALSTTMCGELLAEGKIRVVE